MAYLPAGISMEELLAAAEDLQQMLPTPMPSRPGMGRRPCCCCDYMLLLPPSLLLLQLHALNVYMNGAPALALPCCCYSTCLFFSSPSTGAEPGLAEDAGGEYTPLDLAVLMAAHAKRLKGEQDARLELRPSPQVRRACYCGCCRGGRCCR